METKIISPFGIESFNTYTYKALAKLVRVDYNVLSKELRKTFQRICLEGFLQYDIDLSFYGIPQIEQKELIPQSRTKYKTIKTKPELI